MKFSARMTNSLRLRLLLATSLSSAMVLSLLGLAIYASMRHLLLSDYDASLLAKARAIALTTEQHGRDNKVRSEFDPKQMPEFSLGRHPDYFQIWLDNGRVLDHSESLHGSQLPKTPAEIAAVNGSLSLPGSHHVRLVSLSFTPRLEEEHDGEESTPPHVHTATITVAGAPEETERMLEYLGWLLLASCGIAIVLSGALLLKVVNTSVRPVKRLARSIESFRETDLTARLSTQGVPSELAPMVERLNGLLARLEGAFSREKAFTADVAHELRTPLAGLMTTLEVCRSRRREPGAYETAIDECRQMTDRMQVMIENLLLLARADSGQLPIEQKAVDISLLLSESWSLFEERANGRKLRIDWDLAEGSSALTDSNKLRLVVHNLFDNAVSYTQSGGDIRVSANTVADQLLIEVVNTGSQVAAADMPRLFERFWRGDASRSETGVHCGLGLSLSRRLMSLLGGDISVTSSLGGNFAVQLSLPAAQSANRDVARVTAPLELIA